VLDRDLPEVHGDDVCRTLNAEQPDTKILMLTAARTTDDLVTGLALGADDYLGKPFRFAELIARVHALARRAGPARAPVLRRADIELDPARRAATRAGRDLELSLKEFGVLEALLVADGAVVSTEELLERVWDANVDPFTNTVRMTVMKLRRKLGEPAIVQTVAGAGYRV
jgi:DNA-binding response OmpR family regulator